MFIYNLEVKNFKCLDNYNMPLQFDNLNVLIGENDSGKTSLLEAILIVFGEMKIEKSMFYDNRKEVKIKASFSDIEKQVLESTLLIQGFNITHYELIRNFSNTYISPFIRADNEPEEIIGSYSFLEYIEEYLHVNRNYSFFNDLRDFYIAFLNNIFVTIEKTFYLKKDGEIESSETVYFEYPKNDFIERLVENLDFINYMETYLDKFDDRCKQILNEIIEDEGKFNLNALGNFYGLENEIYVIEDSGERFLNKEKYNKYLDDIRKIYCSTIISDDLEEAIFSKIAKLITVIINRNNCDKVSWDQVSNLRYNLTKEKDISIAAENIIGHHLISLKGFDGSLLPKNDGTIIAKNIINSIEIPEIKFFSTEVINKEVPAKLFDDIYNIKTLENTISEGLENFIKEELEDYVKEWYLSDDESDEFNEFHTGIKSSIVKYMAALNEKISDFDIKINFTDTNFDLLKQIVKPNIEINVKQNGQRVDITQKGQGFLRKLLLSDFLMLLKDYDKYFEKMADKILSSESDDKQIDKTIEENEISARRNRLIMIEEPEIHLHYSAQKKIMKMIKDNLEDSANQVFITTHSHFIIEDINFNDIYIFKKINNTGKTEISNLRNFKESPEILESLQSSLGLKKTDILNLIKLIVLVEGERDTVFLEELCRRPELNINLERIQFMDSEGQEKMEYYIKSKFITKFLGMRELVILDSNPKNNKRKLELENKYPNVVEVMLISKKDIINYIPIETAEKVMGIERGTLIYDKNKQKLETVLERYLKRRITQTDIKEMVAKLRRIDPELMSVVNKIREYQVSYTSFDSEIKSL